MLYWQSMKDFMNGLISFRLFGKFSGVLSARDATFLRTLFLGLTVSVIFSILYFLNATSAYACSPAPGWPPSEKDNYQNSSVVFVGEVKNVSLVGEAFAGTFEITFDIEKSYRGDVAGTAVIKTSASSAACGYDNADAFPVGSVFAVYADANFRTGHLKLNKQYDSLVEATNDLDRISGQIDNTKICTTQYDPVCGRRDTGIRCVTTPCPSSELKTYSNSCFLKNDNAEFVHEGECTLEDGVELPAQTPPDNCKSWFDGCNSCGRTSPGGPMACTLKACLSTEQKPMCKEYFEENVIVDSTGTEVENDDNGKSGDGTDEDGTDSGDDSDNDSGQDSDKKSDRGPIKRFFDLIINFFKKLF